jgi:C1A family cysteine protease
MATPEVNRAVRRKLAAQEVPGTVLVGAMGWMRDLPDLRDYTPETKKVAQLLGQMKVPTAATPAKLPPSVDLRTWCSPIEDQGALGSCTANAGAGMYEYFERRAYGRHIDCSRLFLYKATRNLLRWTGDTGAYLRATMAALRLFGTCPEEYWPYVVSDFDKDPPPFVWSFAENFQALSYYRLDPPSTPTPALLTQIKAQLAAGLPPMFGFTVYASISQAARTGAIPFPVSSERVLGGHAILAVGYDDAKKITNQTPGGPETTGALLIRNSWGTGWGDQGYGWLPYDYVLRGLAVDFWALVRGEFVDLQTFGLR